MKKLSEAIAEAKVALEKKVKTTKPKPGKKAKQSGKPMKSGGKK